MAHDEITPVCQEMFKNINEKLGTLIRIDEARNGKYDKHCASGEEYRVETSKRLTIVEEAIKGISSAKALAWATLITVLLSSFGTIAYFNFVFGQYTRQIEVNTARIAELETIHPRSNILPDLLDKATTSNIIVPINKGN